jgi:hypothetical protein
VTSKSRSWPSDAAKSRFSRPIVCSTLFGLRFRLTFETNGGVLRDGRIAKRSDRASLNSFTTLSFLPAPLDALGGLGHSLRSDDCGRVFSHLISSAQRTCGFKHSALLSSRILRCEKRHVVGHGGRG